MTNQFLERIGSQERVDHRSHAKRGLDEQPTIHEGAVARAMERKGIVSDCCELNRQIRADNALLRELKELVKKLVQALKNTIPTIAKAMETVRQRMIVFRYQLLHIKSGKTQITNALQIVRPDLKRFENIAKQVKSKIQERRSLLEEKQTTPAIQIFRHRELTQKIAALTEDIEELKSEKILLLNQLDCVGDHGMVEVKQRVASMESSLEKLDQQKIKYTAELDSALAEYAKLKKQTEDIDATKLDTARQVIRPDMECETIQQLRVAYRMKFDSNLLAKSRKDVDALLGKEMGQQSLRQQLQQKKQPQMLQEQKKFKHHRREK